MADRVNFDIFRRAKQAPQSLIRQAVEIFSSCEQGVMGKVSDDFVLKNHLLAFLKAI